MGDMYIIQELTKKYLANVFPLFKTALYIITKFTQHVKMSFIKRKLAGLIFENKEKSKNTLK